MEASITSVAFICSESSSRPGASVIKTDDFKCGKADIQISPITAE